MLYIKIGESKYPIKFHSFTTQFGNDAIRIISNEAPLAQNGFLIVDEDDNVISDRSEYVYLYREDDQCKEYTKIPEEIIPAENKAMGDIPESPYSKLSHRISSVDGKVNEITPFEETKKAYYGEKEKTFYDVPNGNVSIFFDNYEGDHKTSRIGNRFIVSFPEKLEKATNITVMVQN